MFIKCTGCNKIGFQAELIEQLSVCDSCGFHHRINSAQWIDLLFDRGAFEERHVEVAARNPLSFPGFDEQLTKARERTGKLSAVICGEAYIEKTKVAVIVFDFQFLGGSIGSAEGEKIARTFESAISNGLPVLAIVASGGARVQEGLFALMQVPKMIFARGKHRDANLKFVVILTDPSMAGSLIGFAMTADAILAEPGARVAFSGARVNGAKCESRAEDYETWGFVKVVLRHKLRDECIHFLSNSK